VREDELHSYRLCKSVTGIDILDQSGELTQLLAAKTSQGVLLTPEVIAREARGLVDRDCLREEVDKEIYDYENARACLRRNSD
jgi:hypothetical protein